MAGAPNSPSTEGSAPASQLATFGAGCFWCVEAVFQRLEGVESVVSGYSGGHVENPTYKQVTTGRTGHAEVVQVRFDPAVISYETLLEVFFNTHDPTTLNRQGADVGPQYRSVVFYHDDAQRAAAERAKRELNASGAFSRPVVTQIAAMTKFYEAEEYHQDYFRRNPDKAYCQVVINPKLQKFQSKFRDRLKQDE